MKPVLAACSVLAVGLHAAILSLPANPGRAPSARQGGAAGPARIQITLSRAAQHVDADAAPPREAIERPVSPTLATASATARPADEPSIAQRPERSGLSSPPDADAAAADYVPRPQLTAPPVARGTVMLTYPDDAPQRGSFVAVLALYIDEIGHVRAVRFEGDPLPAGLERVARATFMAANFRPGELDGQQVKSLVHVEVRFDSRPVEPELTDPRSPSLAGPD